MSGLYDDIIGLPHHVSANRPQMPMADRAAQFSPFAALTGYDAAIRETGRLTAKKIDLDQSALNILDRKLQTLMEQLDAEPEVTFTYFESDARKVGGAYTTVTGIVKKVDEFKKQIVLQNGVKLPIENILQMEGDIFPFIY